MRPPDEKVEQISSFASRVAETARYPLPLLESLMGKIVSVEKVVPWGRLNYRAFQQVLLRELRMGRSFRWVKCTEDARKDLLWWGDSQNLTQWVPLTPPQPQVVVLTDASTKGWGATCSDWTLNGVWSLQESKEHINCLEMKAVLLTLQSRRESLRGKVVCFRIDNLSVVFYLNKQGGTRSLSLLKYTEQVLRLAAELNIVIQAVHIKGELNVLADMLSREGLVLKNEWRLSARTFEWVCRESPWGLPTVDLFANRLNKQLSMYFSPCHDNQAMGVDALLCSWPNLVCYAFPPTTILDKVALKIQQERPSRLLLVAPWWPTKPWFPTLMSNSLVVKMIPQSSLILVTTPLQTRQ